MSLIYSALGTHKPWSQMRHGYLTIQFPLHAEQWDARDEDIRQAPSSDWTAP